MKEKMKTYLVFTTDIRPARLNGENPRLAEEQIVLLGVVTAATGTTLILLKINARSLN